MAILFYWGRFRWKAALMLVNKTDVDIKKDLNFSITWSYDGKAIFENQKVSYFIKDSGELPSHTATIILLPLNEEQQNIVDGMSDPSKMKLLMSDEHCRVIMKQETYKGEVNAPCLSYDWFFIIGTRELLGFHCQFYRQPPFYCCPWLALLKVPNALKPGFTKPSFIKPM